MSKKVIVAHLNRQGVKHKIDGDVVRVVDDINGWLDLGGLTSAEGLVLPQSIGGWLDLGGLTALPEGLDIRCDGNVYSNVSQQWRGMRLVSCDGTVSVACGRPHAVGDATVQKARYFRGLNEPGNEHYIATVGWASAHGSTAAEAIEDARFKLLESDQDDVVQEIRETQRVTVGQYRAITGACREGCRQWMVSHGIAEGQESISLGSLLALLGNSYGADKFRELVS